MINKVKIWLASLFKNKRTTAKELQTMLFDQSPLPQAMISDQGIYFDVNNAYCTLHDVNRVELIGKTPADVGFSSDDDLRHILLACAQLNNPEGYMLKYPTSVGRLLSVQLFAHGVTINGQSCILMVLHDISNQRGAEKAVKESETFLQTVLNSIPTRVFWKHKNSVFRGCNQMTANDAGFASAAGIVGKTDYDYNNT